MKRPATVLQPGLLALAGLLLLPLMGLGATGHAAPVAPSGVRITPLAAAGAHFTPLNPHLPDLPDYTAGQAVTTLISPDGETLLVLTSGYNRLYDADGKMIKAASNEYIFVYDIASGTPKQSQTLQIPNAYMGLAFAPDGRHFYVSGGVDDDVHVFSAEGGRWSEDAAALIKLGHAEGKGLMVKPEAAGLAVTADGGKLLVADFYNDALSVVPLANGVPSGPPMEISLQPGGGKAGGTYPFWIAVKNSGTAYVSSMRDREIDVVNLGGAAPIVSARIPVEGNPNRLLLNHAGSRLYVTSDNADIVSVIDTETNRALSTIRTIAPPALMAPGAYYHGVAPNSLALSPDEKHLYVTNGGENALAIIDLNAPKPAVTGLIPTGYWPNSVSAGRDGKMLYVVNGKSIPGANPKNCQTSNYDTAHRAGCRAANQYILQLSKAGFLTLPVPDPHDLSELTRTVAANDHLSVHMDAEDRRVMAALHQRIKHVIYIVRENRTYDQELGDLGIGNGDPDLAEFGKALTPNAHTLAEDFVTLDNFFDTGEVSGNGWPWSTSAMESDLGAKNLPVNYAGRGLSYDWEGTNRDVNVGIPDLAGRKAAEPGYPDDADLLPGTANVAAPDGPEQDEDERQQGYIWDSAARAGLSVRNYGFMLDLAPYDNPLQPTPQTEDPFAAEARVAFPANPQLAPVTDPYFRGFDVRFPDYFREAEWEREFKDYVANGKLPALSLVRLMRDHLGGFDKSIDGLDTPEAQVADNDYAVGKLVEAVAKSPYAQSTLIFVIEDDAQDGPDHVDAHRSVCFIAGPYVKQHQVVSERYSTVNLLTTIEDILGLDHLSIYDANQRPMTAVFDLDQTHWNFEATEPVPFAAAYTGERRAEPRPSFHFAQTPAYWAKATKGMRWDKEDDNPAPLIEQIYWRGLKPGIPYPQRHSGVK
jgi:YVTN family beta-propeller protein